MIDGSSDIVDYSAAIEEIAALISSGNIYRAREVAKAMPLRIKKKKVEVAKPALPLGTFKQVRTYSIGYAMKVFVRDGFTDRYTGLKIVIPPALRLISEIIPLEFPYHPNWAEGKCHDCYWDLSATVDHLHPIALGGSNEFDNLVSTSMSKNIQKNSLSLELLGWKLYEQGDIERWDGLSQFYLEQCNKNTSVLKIPYFKKWYKVLEKTSLF